MKVEREIAGLALPFAAGITISVYAWSLFSDNTYLWTSASFITIAISVAVLSGNAAQKLKHFQTWSMIICAAAAAGCLCGFTSEIMNIGRTETRHWMEAAAGEAIKTAIDIIPFKDKTTSAIIKALITGERSGIPPDITAAFRDSGASHILALSGLHLGMIYGAVGKLTAILGSSVPAQRTRSLISIMLCGLYTLATGAGPSIVRAFIFILLGETAGLTGRYRSTGSILFSALILQLAISPQSIGSVGFQLSYAAMAGIAFIYPKLRDIWPEERRVYMRCLGRIWNSAAISIACQLTTGPLAYAYFGTLPKYFLMTNLIAVPLTGIIIPASLLTLVLEICGICPAVLIEATETLVSILRFSLENIASM
ncbi:MAG: ComEC/Rec2 family competence protein [Bacteroidales bacterium]|nr:ComEC/Rec2 family competence protein [Bacteroidales bacterium]